MFVNHTRDPQRQDLNVRLISNKIRSRLSHSNHYSPTSRANDLIVCVKCPESNKKKKKHCTKNLSDKEEKCVNFIKTLLKVISFLTSLYSASNDLPIGEKRSDNVQCEFSFVGKWLFRVARNLNGRELHPKKDVVSNN